MKKTLFILSVLSIGSTQAQLRELFDRETSYGHFSGTVRVVRGDSTVFEYAGGSLDGEVPISLDTRFDIGSVSKQFTAAAILHLVEEGLISLEDPINNHLGNLASKRWSKVTIHHLLTHTGGVPSLYQTDQGLELFLPEEDSISRAELVGRFREAKLLFSPGEEFNYSNSGYILLGVIIEHVSGMSYADFMKIKIFDRYGLESTTVGRPRDVDCALPFYGYRDDLVIPAPNLHISWFFASGGIYSNTSDLIRWVRVIGDEALLNKRLRSLFLISHSGVGYGYGWQHPKGTDIIEHDGGNAGFIAMLSFNPKTEEIIAILTNRSFRFEDIYNFGKSADYVRDWKNEIWKYLENEKIELLPRYQQYNCEEGVFVHKDLKLHLEKKDTVLQLKLSGGVLSRLIPNTSIKDNSGQPDKLSEIAEYLKTGRYWSLAKYCDGEMKFVCYSGMMSIGMKMVKKKVGEATEFTPYYMDKNESYGLIRMKGTERILDLIIYFDDEGKLIGIFENGFYSLDEEFAMVAYPIGDNLYHLDGIPYGEKSATLKIDRDGLRLQQFDRSILFKKIPK